MQHHGIPYIVILGFHIHTLTQKVTRGMEITRNFYWCSCRTHFFWALINEAVRNCIYAFSASFLSWCFQWVLFHPDTISNVVAAFPVVYRRFFFQFCWSFTRPTLQRLWMVESFQGLLLPITLQRFWQTQFCKVSFLNIILQRLLVDAFFVEVLSGATWRCQFFWRLFGRSSACFLSCMFLCGALSCRGDLPAFPKSRTLGWFRSGLTWRPPGRSFISGAFSGSYHLKVFFRYNSADDVYNAKTSNDVPHSML